ncbi:MAG: IS30 family transposase [Oscillospiraceae bacterium]|nr:IS30 family transposase [Oscillospiraceae bacterium]
MKKYRRMTWTDRLIIEKFYNKGLSYRKVAEAVGFSVSSVYAEIQHGLYPHMGAEVTKRPFHYSAKIAQDYADIQATGKGPSLKLGHHYDFAATVEEQVKQGRSVSHIVMELRRNDTWTVSPSTLYRYIDRGYIPGVTNKHLPEKSRRKRPHNQVRAARAPKGTSIERRPGYINDRSVFGHWEMDSVIGKAKGKRQSFVVLTERMTRFQLVFHARSKEAASTVSVLDSALSKFPKGTFQTITVDNGCEFQDCYGMEHDRQGNKRLTVYYCHPYTSCERGSNERANRIIRRFFPKGKSLYSVTQSQCNEVAHFMNTMRRKVLDYDTAEERFNWELAKLL